MKSMPSFAARHVVDRQANMHKWNSESDPSAGFIAWLLWGGDAGRAWAERKLQQLENRHES
ncbi:hypothetical protein WBP07_20605 (plasmid) [Novosphingobium sp. BL-8A]